MKRPAAAGGTPPVPEDRQGQTIIDDKGKVNVSLAKEGHRAFPTRDQAVDKLVKWKHYETRQSSMGCSPCVGEGMIASTI
jgi:hypothetical protein